MGAELPIAVLCVLQCVVHILPPRPPKSGQTAHRTNTRRMGGCKPKPSGAAATRVMMRRGEGRVLPEAVRRGLYEGKRTQWVKLARKNNTTGKRRCCR